MAPIHRDFAGIVALITESLGAVAAQTYVVGGYLRDVLLGHTPRDIDIVVPGDQVEVAQRLAAGLHGVVVPFGGDWGVTRLIVPFDDGPMTVDVGSMRGDITSDLAKRDFTINAMAMRLTAPNRDAEVVDPFGGRQDLENKVVRATAPEVFDADPLRMLRAVRIAAELDFAIAPDTIDAIRAYAQRADEPAPERKRDELLRLFDTNHAAKGLRQLDEAGVLTVLFPEVLAAKGCEQPKEHYWEVFDHLIETVRAMDAAFGDAQLHDERERKLREVFVEEMAPLSGWEAFYRSEFADGSPRRTYLKLACFLHDVSKPETKTIDNGRIRFFGHSEVGAHRTAGIMERLRFSGKAIKLVSLLIDEHLRPTQLASPGQPPTKKALYRFRRDTGDAALDVLLLSIFDHAAARGPDIDWEDWRNHIRYALYVLHNIWKDGEPVKHERVISGHDLMSELGLAPGKRVGELLEAVDEAYHSGEVSNRDQAIAFARRLAAQ